MRRQILPWHTGDEKLVGNRVETLLKLILTAKQTGMTKNIGLEFLLIRLEFLLPH